MKTLKAIAILFVAGLLTINLAIACGGMSPQPAPGDFDTDVPALPADTTDTTNDDVTTDSHDCPFPGDIQTEEEDNNDNNQDLNNLPSDLPTLQAGEKNSTDGQFVDIVL